MTVMKTVGQLAKGIGVSKACQWLGVPRSSWYRQRNPPKVSKKLGQQNHSRGLSESEMMELRSFLNSERFQDCSPRQVYASLLDEGIYLCSWRSMYRILAKYDEICERRAQRKPTSYAKPELLATAPNQLWSWDITKLKGSTTWVYHYLYVILDVFSRYVVGWMIAECERDQLARQLINHTCQQQGIQPKQLTLHADRGSSMRSKTVAELLDDLGVTKTHSRPYTANDNPYSEAQFKTLKYRPTYPDRFGSILDARAWARPFFRWYNHEHYHSGICLLTPASVHLGHADTILNQRQLVLDQAFQQHPERFVNGPPHHPKLPKAVWINPPDDHSGSIFY